MPPPPETQVPQPEAGPSLSAPQPESSAPAQEPPVPQESVKEETEQEDQHDQLQEGSPATNPNGDHAYAHPPPAETLPAPALQLPPQQQRTVYTAKLVVNLPASTSRAQSQVHVDLRLQEPSERDLSLPERQVALQVCF